VSDHCAIAHNIIAVFSTQFYELAIVITAVIARKRPKEMLPPRRTHPGFWPPPDIAKVLKTFANPTFVSMPNLGSVRNLHTTSVSICENKCNELHEAKNIWVYVAKRQLARWKRICRPVGWIGHNLDQLGGRRRHIAFYSESTKRGGRVSGSECLATEPLWNLSIMSVVNPGSCTERRVLSPTRHVLAFPRTAISAPLLIGWLSGLLDLRHSLS